MQNLLYFVCLIGSIFRLETFVLHSEEQGKLTSTIELLSVEMSSALEAGFKVLEGRRARSRRRGAERHPPWGETEFIRGGGGVFFSIGAAGALTSGPFGARDARLSNFHQNFKL